MQMEARGIPGVLVITQPFKSLAENALKARNLQDIPVHVLPHPMETKPDDEVRAIVDEHIPSILSKLQKPGTEPVIQP